MSLIDYLLLTPLDEEWRTLMASICPDPAAVSLSTVAPITFSLWRHATVTALGSPGEHLVVGAAMSRLTPGESYAGVFATHCVNTWKPQRIILLGIAGSFNSERVRLGDVVVADQIYGYEVADVDGRRMTFRPTFNQPGASDLDRVRAFRADRRAYPIWQQRCLDEAEAAGIKDLKRPPELHIEGIASGNYVVKSVSFGRKLREEIHWSIVAVEMEGRGLHQALYLNSHRADPLMVRGISDGANLKKEDLDRGKKGSWRQFATANASRLVTAIWEHTPTLPLSPSYELDLTRGQLTRFRQPGVPNILNKRIGAQNLAFPTLLNRTSPNPPLRLVVQAHDANGVVANFDALCLARTPSLQTIAGLPLPRGGRQVLLPASEYGLRVELLLSFPTTVLEVRVICVDDFGRRTEAQLSKAQQTR